MQEFQERKKFKRIIFSKLALFILLAVFVFISTFTVKVFLKSRKAGERKEEILEKLNQIEKQKSSLEENIKRLQSEAGVEEEIRKNLGMAKPGEEVLVIMDKKEDNGKIEPRGITGFLQKIWQFIKDFF